MEEVILQWLGLIVASIAAAVATYHFKGKEALQRQVERNTQEILRLKAHQASGEKLLTQKLSSVEAELKDLKESVRDDVLDIKESIKLLTTSMSSLAASQGEMRGTLVALLKEK